MTNNQKRVEDFNKRIPSQAADIPISKNGMRMVKMPDLKVRVLRAKLMLEECIETIQDGLGLDVLCSIAAYQQADNPDKREIVIKFENLYFLPSKEHGPDMVALADGLADQDVVILGTAQMAGIDMEAIFNEVMDNNELKIDKGTIDQFGKLVKPKDHPLADVKGQLARQGWSKPPSTIEYE